MIREMSTEFDWFMVTMPIFAIVVYAIVMIGSMEKQPKFLETEGVKKLTSLVFVGLFGIGILVSLYYMIVRFIDLLANYWSYFPIDADLRIYLSFLLEGFRATRKVG